MLGGRRYARAPFLAAGIVPRSASRMKYARRRLSGALSNSRPKTRSGSTPRRWSLSPLRTSICQRSRRRTSRAAWAADPAWWKKSWRCRKVACRLPPKSAKEVRGQEEPVAMVVAEFGGALLLECLREIVGSDRDGAFLCTELLDRTCGCVAIRSLHEQPGRGLVHGLILSYSQRR